MKRSWMVFQGFSVWSVLALCQDDLLCVDLSRPQVSSKHPLIPAKGNGNKHKHKQASRSRNFTASNIARSIIQGM